MSTTTRKRVKPARSLNLKLAPFEGNPGVLVLTVGTLTTRYFLQPLPADFGSAYRLTKESGEDYDVLLATDGSTTCECKGFLRWHHCKHISSLAELRKRGLL